MAWRFLARGTLLLLLLASHLQEGGCAAAADGVYDDIKLTRLAFGSCSKQYKNQTLWGPIIAFEPQVYLWTGDVIYVKDGSIASLHKSFEKQLQQPGYRKLVKTGPIIEGVYDDHDYGENDGDARVYEKGRQDAYLDFLGVPASSPRRERHGLYSSHTFGIPPHQVRVIFLDTRSTRCVPALNVPVPNWVPLKPFVLAALRWVAVAFQVTKDYEGDVLGEEQWSWLEDQLTTSEASIHLIVSTIQVLSTNPIVEGWGHYPGSQKRLLALLDRTSPKGLVLLSGDVHFAELLSTQSLAEKEAAPGTDEAAAAAATAAAHRVPLEVTSSGMTHTCTQTAFGACKVALNVYNRHRFKPTSVYTGLNYGTVEIEWDPNDETRADFAVRVRNMFGRSVLEANKTVPVVASGTVEGGSIGFAYLMTENQDSWAVLSALALLFWSSLAWLGWSEASAKAKKEKEKEEQAKNAVEEKKKK